MLKVELITPCKGRGEHLRQAWPSYAGQIVPGYDYSAVVVDYGCPDIAANPDLQSCRRIVVTQGTEFYSHPRPRNIGACQSQADVLFFLDCDFVLPLDFVKRNMDQMTGEGLELLICADGPEQYFCCFFVTRAGFHQVRGFDERFEGWGYDDVDFLHRCRQSGLKWNWTLATGLYKIPHTDADSTKHFVEKSKEKSAAANLQVMAPGPFRPVNPEGYGRLEVF